MIIVVFGDGYKNIEMQKDEVLVAHFGGRQEGRGGRERVREREREKDRVRQRRDTESTSK